MVTVAFSELRQNLRRWPKGLPMRARRLWFSSGASRCSRLCHSTIKAQLRWNMTLLRSVGVQVDARFGQAKRDVGTMWHPKITWKEIREMLAEDEDYQEYLDIVAKMPKGTPLDTMTVEDEKRIARERYL